MKPENIFKDIFGLAVRLLGLYFLCLGLKDIQVQTLMDMNTLKGDNLDDIITALLPVLFNLAVAWWLLGGALIIRRAYPGASRISSLLNSLAVPPSPAVNPVQSQGLSERETTEKKLSALVVNPKDKLG